MLRPVRLVAESAGSFWTIAPSTGSLLRHEETPRASLLDRRPPLVTEALSFVEQPFACRSLSPAPIVDVEQSASWALQKMHARLRRIGNQRFLLSYLYAGIARPMFATTREAMAAVAALPDQRTERTSLCLQRVLLVAKISRSFAEHGVAFIGANLQTGDMHAWIIESGEQPDTDDRSWINYRPLLAIVGIAF